MVRGKHFRVTTESLHGGVVCVVPEGELDLATTPGLQTAVEDALAAGPDQVVIDLSKLAFVDSTGLRMFLALHERAVSDGWTLTLARPSEAVNTIFDITRSRDSLPIVEDWMPDS